VNSDHPGLDSGAVRRLTMAPGPWLSCDDCFHLVDQHVEAVLAGGTTLPAMRAHLAGCPACCEEAQSLLVLAAAERGQDPGPALSRLAGGDR
jgi:hypothetical protein